MADSNVELMTPEEIERFKSMFKSLPIVAEPTKDENVERTLKEIVRELKKIRHAIERRR